MSLNPCRADQLSVFTSETPCFFKVMLSNAIRAGKLGIPKQFTRKYGTTLRKQVTLKVLPHTVWKIGLTRSDGILWLQNGWKEFSDYYSLAHGHFLVFRLMENSDFSVSIFDMTASEIDYPYEDKDSEMEDSVSVEILDDIPECSKRKQKTSDFSNPQPRKAVKIARFGTRKSQDGDSGISTVLSHIQSKIRRMKSLTFDEKALCLEIASGFVTDYPHFKIVVQPSFICAGGIMNVPVAFARKYFDKKKETITLLNSSRKSWPASYHTSPGAESRPKILCGWVEFARDNNLEIGDVCAFEMIKHDEKLFRVSTFKFRENLQYFLSLGESSSSGCNLKKNMNPLKNRKNAGEQCAEGPSHGRIPGPREIANKFTSEYPYFKVSFCPSHHYNVLIKQTAEQDETLVHLQVGEKSWPVKLRSYLHRGYKKGVFCWSEFARENSLQIGDCCLFELINKDDVVVKVSIFKNVS
ncbi:hypothetical protein ACFE04_023221 [Oxalis oulophora]